MNLIFYQENLTQKGKINKNKGINTKDGTGKCTSDRNKRTYCRGHRLMRKKDQKRDKILQVKKQDVQIFKTKNNKNIQRRVISVCIEKQLVALDDKPSEMDYMQFACEMSRVVPLLKSGEYAL